MILLEICNILYQHEYTSLSWANIIIYCYSVKPLFPKKNTLPRSLLETCHNNYGVEILGNKTIVTFVN